MTLNEIAYSIKNRLEGFSPSDDSLFEDEYIYSRIHVARSDLIRRLENKKESLDDDFYQKICCLEIECEKEICDGVTLDTRLVVKLPGIVSINKGMKYFGTTDLKNGFQYVSNTGFLFNEHSQFASRSSYYTVIGSNAIVRNLPTPDMKYVCIIAILDNPLDGKCVDVSADEEYPLPQIYVEEIENKVIESIIPSLSIFPDMANDATPDARANAFNLYGQIRNKRRPKEQ